MSFKAVMPNFSRFNVLAGIGRMFAKDHLIDVLKMVALASVIGTVGAMYLKSQFMAMANLLPACPCRRPSARWPARWRAASACCCCCWAAGP